MPPGPQKRSLVIAGALLLAATASACSLARTPVAWPGYEGPGQEYFEKTEYEFPAVNDPLEPVNRSMWVANNGVAYFLISPAGRIWRALVPRRVRTSLLKASHNLLYPARLVNNGLQGNWRGMRGETVRFATNTTVGIAGLFDPARKWGYLPSDEDAGQTMKVWGWNDSTYMVLPTFGPSSLRDSLGTAVDTALDPLTYFFPFGLARTFIEQAEAVESYKRFVQTYYDAYLPARRLYVANREALATTFRYRRKRGAEQQTMQAIFLAPRDERFPFQSKRRTAPIGDGERRVIYEEWIQPDPAPVVFIVPGLGSHRRSSHALALAEVVYKAGFSAVTISSAMSFDFMESASSAWVPGYGPIDAADVREALEAAYHDIERRHKNRTTSRVLLGMSLGAFHTMLIAANAVEDDGFSFDRYVAINPPVRVLYGMQRLDNFYNVPLTYPADERDARVLATLKRITAAGLGGTLKPGAPLPLAEPEAEFSIGLNFRLSLHDVIWSSQSRHDMGLLATPMRWMRRANTSREIFQISFMEYFYGFILPYLTEVRGELESAEEAIAASELTNRGEPLRANEDLRVFTNHNDFLLTERDVQWLVDTLGPERVLVYETGGHLGNLYLPEVQQDVVTSISDLLERR